MNGEQMDGADTAASGFGEQDASAAGTGEGQPEQTNPSQDRGTGDATDTGSAFAQAGLEESASTIVAADLTGDGVVDVLGADVDGDGTLDMIIVDEGALDAGTEDPTASMDDGLAMGSDFGEDVGMGVAITGTSDPVYDLVSVLYHALQGAETTVIYSDDAAFSGDSELVDFFADVQAQDRERAARAKALLRRYLAAE